MNEVTEIVSGTFAEETAPFLEWAKGLLTWGNLFHIIFALILILVLWFVYKLALRGIKKIPAFWPGLASTCFDTIRSRG